MATSHEQQLADLLGVEPGSPELLAAETKLATQLGCDPASRRVLEAAQRLAAAPVVSPALRPRPRVALSVIRALKPVTLVGSPQRIAPDDVDADRLDLDRRVRAHAAEQDLPYPRALEAVRGW